MKRSIVAGQTEEYWAAAKSLAGQPVLPAVEEDSVAAVEIAADALEHIALHGSSPSLRRAATLALFRAAVFAAEGKK